MMAQMVAERGGRVGTMDDRYCIDNGAMIAWAGLELFKTSQFTQVKDCTITQRLNFGEFICTLLVF